MGKDNDRGGIRVAGKVRSALELMLHVLLVGMTGAGKTSLIAAMLRDAAARFYRILWYDSDGDQEKDLLGWAAHENPGYQVANFNPFFDDPKGVAIDFAAMIKSLVEAQYFAARILQPSKHEHQEYFLLTAQRMLVAAIMILIRLAPDDWTICDLLRLVKNPEFCELLAEICDMESPYAVMGSADGSADVISTLHTRLAQLSAVAALMHHARRPAINPRTFEGGLKFCRHERLNVALNSITGYVMDDLTDYRLEHPGSEPLFMFLDEVRTLPRMSALNVLARRGRKTNTCLVLGLHEIDGFYDVYGREAGEEALALLAQKIFLKVAGVNSARWAAEYLGNVEILEGVRNFKGDDMTITRRERFNVTPDELRRLPLPDAKRDVIRGVYDGPEECYFFETPWLRAASPPPGWRPAALKPYPAEWQILPRWTVDDFARLRLPVSDPRIMAFDGR